MKKYIIGFIIGLSVCGVVYAYDVMPNEYKIVLNGVDVQIEGYNIDGYSYFKLRDIGEVTALFNVDFSDEKIIINYKKEDMPVDSENYIIDGHIISKPIIKDRITVILIDGIDNVRLRAILGNSDIGEKLEDDGSLSIGRISTNECLLSDIPYIVIQDVTYIPYDYYENYIKPLLLL